MTLHPTAQALPNYARRAKKAVLARERVIKKVGPLKAGLIDSKQAKHGLKWSIRTALTEFKIEDPLVRNKTIQTVTKFYSLQQELSEFNQKRSESTSRIAPEQRYPNGQANALNNLQKSIESTGLELVHLMGSKKNAELFLSRIYLHQKNLSLAWNKQEEILKYERTAKSQ
jgi:hypothetical protein